jgi:hypothetical protein
VKAARQALSEADYNSLTTAVLEELLSEVTKIANEVEAILRLRERALKDAYRGSWITKKAISNERKL